MKKALSILLILSIFTMMSLTSCETAEKLLKRADKVLTESSYAVNIDVSVETSSDTLNTVISSIAELDLKMTVDGEDKLALCAILTTAIAGTEVTYTIIEDTAYLNTTFTSLGYESSEFRASSTVDETQIEKLRDTIAIGTKISYIDFDTVELERDEENRLIVVCKNIKSDAIDYLANMASLIFDDINGTVAAKNAELSLAFEDGKYSTLTLLTDYEITVAGITQTVTAKIVMDYEYGEETKLSVPQNPDDYLSVDFDELYDALNAFLK